MDRTRLRIDPDRRLAVVSALLCLALWWTATAGAAEPDARRLGASGQPLPRFVSLRASEVNLRTGPGMRYPIDWIYRRRGLPVEVIDEFEAWRRVRDHEGTVGWVHRSMLTTRRTVLVQGGRRLLRRQPDPGAPGLAYLEAGVIGEFEECRSNWCRLETQGYEGWVPREDLYGVGPGD